MKKIIGLIFFIFSVTIFAQDPHFSQYYSNPLQLNPSLAGSMGASRFVAAYRSQWPKLKAYKTGTFSYDRQINFLHGGIGVIVLRDYEGNADLKIKKITYGKSGMKRYTLGNSMLQTTRIGFIYSPAFLVAEKISIKPSFEIALFQKTIDWSKLTFGDMIDPRYGFVYNSKEIPGANSKSGVDFSSGILVNTKKWNAGFAFHHLTQPDEGLMGSSKLPRKYTLHSSYVFSKNDSAGFAFAPAVLFMSQGSATMFLISTNFKYRWIWWGYSYRLQDALILQIGCNLKKIRIGYSYDITISALKLATIGGSHECNLSYAFGFKKNEGKVIPLKSFAF